MLGGCGGGGGDDVCTFDLSFQPGNDGSAAPLGAGANEARAGRMTEAMLPANPVGLWRAGDFVLANDKVALMIEDVGHSDLYDPWGGRPIGVARVDGGAMVEAGDFGEFFILTGRNSVMTTSVGVIADGSDGGPAIVRAVGTLHPTPFFESITSGLFRETYEDVPTAIDYVLEPGSEHVDIIVTYHSPRTTDSPVDSIVHGFMFSYRSPRFAPGWGFDVDGNDLAYMGFIDDDSTSYAYSEIDGELLAAINVSGFSSNYSASDGFTIAACGETSRTHARMTIGGPGLDGLVQAVGRTNDQTLRAISGVVRDAGGAPLAGARIHAEAATGYDYLTRTTTAEDGSYTVHVPSGVAVTLTAYRRGYPIAGPTEVGASGTSQDFQFGAVGHIHVAAEDADSGAPLPVRVQVMPAGSSAVPELPGYYGEPMPTSGRLHVEYVMDGDITLTVPAGDWEVVVSRGYEYELHEEVVAVAADATTEVAAALPRVVDTAGRLCADYHIHTSRSADAEDDGAAKLAQAVADGLEIPIRSDHEWVDDFSMQIADLGVSAWAYGMASVELTTMQLYGHFGVIPLEVDPAKPNQGTPLWQEFPSADSPDTELRTLPPPELFDQVRARPEQPTIIINHPRGSTNYFGYAGYDADTGVPLYPELWDEEFTVVEVFNDSGWVANRNGNVKDWLSLLTNGRRVFAVGSSDSHGIKTSPVGYPRTCLDLGTDDPTAIDERQVADATAAGHGVVSGGIYVTADVAGAGPGEEATGVGATTEVNVTVQAASWIDVDFLEIVVDGVVTETIEILPADADPENPTIRFSAPLQFDVASAGSYVIIAAYGDEAMEPVHPGRIPFGVTNPIFVSQ